MKDTSNISYWKWLNNNHFLIIIISIGLITGGIALLPVILGSYIGFIFYKKKSKN